jgi:hypothetical protein
MFLDIAHSTGVAEAMGELRVHDRITRFFFDIDEPISSHGGAVHAYVGDEVIVCWPVTTDPARNGRCALCFFAIERSMGALQQTIVVSLSCSGLPGWLHARPVTVSECGDVTRQLAFSATPRTSQRGYASLQGGRSAVGGLGICCVTGQSSDLGGQSIAVRGRREQVAAHIIQHA